MCDRAFHNSHVHLTRAASLDDFQMDSPEAFASTPVVGLLLEEFRTRANTRAEASDLQVGTLTPGIACQLALLRRCRRLQLVSCRCRKRLGSVARLGSSAENARYAFISADALDLFAGAGPREP